MKLPSAASSIAVPLEPEASAAPLFSVRLAAEPGVVVMAIALPPALIDPSDSDCALFKTNAPTMPEVEIDLTRLLPVRLTVPPPLSARVAAVIMPVPDNVAPEATDVVAVPVPTLRLPARLIQPALAVVVPV